MTGAYKALEESSDNITVCNYDTTPEEFSEIRMRLLKGCLILYTKFTFFGVRISVIGAILVCLSITLVILEQA